MELERKLQEAISEIEEGNKDKARSIVRDFIKANPKNEMAWWIYAKIAQNIEQRIFCLEKVIELNPDFKNANEQLKRDKDRLNSSPALQSSKQGKTTKKGINPMIIAIACLAVIVIGLSGYIVYANFIQPQKTNPPEDQYAEDNQETPIQALPTTSIDTPVSSEISTTPALSDQSIIGDPRSFVLPLTYLPPGFSYDAENTMYLSNEYIAQNHDNPVEYLAQLEDWGRIDGFIAAYESVNTYVHTNIVILETAEGAHKYFSYIENEDSTNINLQPVSMPLLADESHATREDENNNGVNYIYYLVRFRKNNIIGIVFAGSRAEYADFDTVLDLAETLESRISDSTPETIVPLLPTSVPVSNMTPTPETIQINETKELGPILNSIREEEYIIQITLNSVRFNKGTEYNKPKVGHIYVIVDVTIKNLGPDPIRSIGKYDFQVRDGSGALRDPGYIPDTNYCELDSVDLSKDGSVSGCFGFEVPIEGGLELIYAPYNVDSLGPGRYIGFDLR